MNTIFESYSNIYNVALMQNVKAPKAVADAKSSGLRSAVARLLGRA
jgi:hypothetical protein